MVAQLPLPYFLIPIIIGSAATATATRSSNHPPVLHSKFLSHLHCPYAHNWLRVGPERASVELFGLEKSSSSFDGGEDKGERRPTAAATEGRELFGASRESSPLPPDPSSSKGSCVFANAFTNAQTCTQYHGEGWTAADMEATCASASDGTGAFASDAACANGTGSTLAVVVFDQWRSKNDQFLTIRRLKPPRGAPSITYWY
jgi:hypothetical protein